MIKVLKNGTYEVTPGGEIYSYHKAKRLIKPSKMKDNYCRVGLSYLGIAHYVKVHRLVCIALHPLIAGKCFVNHIDSNRANNHPKNLEWVTTLENSKHAANAGSFPSINGEKNYNAKLSLVDVEEIRRRYALGGISQEKLGLEFGVKQNTISSVITGTNWGSYVLPFPASLSVAA